MMIMNNLTVLKSALCELATKQNEDFDSRLFASQLQKAIENSGLDDSTFVPDWLVLFFDALSTGKTVPQSSYVHNKTSLRNISNFLVELADILHLQWQDEGEYVTLVADKLQTFGIISIEDDTYEVGRLYVEPLANEAV